MEVEVLAAGLAGTRADGYKTDQDKKSAGQSVDIQGMLLELNSRS